MTVETDAEVCQEFIEVSGTGDRRSLGYSDIMLQEIGRKLVGSWKKLGIFLGISYECLEEMVVVKTVQDMSMEMFRAWWSVTTNHARWGELHHAYASVHRQDLLVQTQNFFATHNLDYNFPDPHTMDRYFLTMSESLAREWDNMGMYLGLSSERLATIRRQPEQDLSLHCFKVLKMWQAEPRSTHHELIRVLMDDMSRSDVARYVLLQLEHKERRCREEKKL